MVSRKTRFEAEVKGNLVMAYSFLRCSFPYGQPNATKPNVNNDVSRELSRQELSFKE